MTHTFDRRTFKDYETALKKLREQRVGAVKSVERLREDLAAAERGVEAIDSAISDGEQIVAYMTFVNLQAGAAEPTEAMPEVTR